MATTSAQSMAEDCHGYSSVRDTIPIFIRSGISLSWSVPLRPVLSPLYNFKDYCEQQAGRAFFFLPGVHIWVE